MPLAAPNNSGDNLTTVFRHIVSYLYALANGGSQTNITPPSIEVQGGGSPIPGSILQGTAGIWSGSPTLTYQWKKDGSDIPGETSIFGYSSTFEDIGSAITLLEIPNGNTASGVSSNSIEIVDPLAGIVFEYGRLQTHNGNNVPLGLYQDEAGTIPATAEFDIVMCWRDELTASGVQATQSDPDKSPMLVFNNGVPMLEFDQSDDFLVHGQGASAAASIFAVARNNSAVAYQMLAGYGAPGGPNTYSFLPGSSQWGSYLGLNVTAGAGNTVFHVMANITRAPNDVDFYTDNSAVVNRTNGFVYDASNGQCIGAEAGGAAAFFGGQIGAVMAGPHTDYSNTAIQTYLLDIFSDVIGT